MIQAFDFDKTLTYQDSLLGFFREVSPSTIAFRLRWVPFLAVAVLHKLKLASNDQLKAAGVALFLKGKGREEIHAAAQRYATKIKYNDLYRRLPEVTAKATTVIIVTASFEEYVGVIFPQAPYSVIGARLAWQNDRVVGLERNCYAAQKVDALEQIGITSVDEFYTDSESDRPVMNLAQRVFMVDGDVVSEK